MSESDKKKRKSFPNMATPKGIAGYIWAHKPSTKFDAEGVFEATVTFEADDVAELREQMNKIANDFRDEKIAEAEGEKKGKLKRSTVKECGEPVFDEDGNETGQVKIKFRQKRLIKFKDGTTKEVKPWVKDAKKNDTDAIPFAGSVVRVVFQPNPYYKADGNEFGTSMRFKGLQIIELVSGGTGGDSGAGLLDEEDGWTDDANDGAGALDDAGNSGEDAGDEEDF